MIRRFSHDSGDKRQQSDEEEPHAVHQEDPVIDPLRWRHTVVVFVPGQENLYETDDIRDHRGPLPGDCREACFARNVELQHHDGGSDGDDTVGDSKKSAFVDHVGLSFLSLPEWSANKNISATAGLDNIKLKTDGFCKRRPGGILFLRMVDNNERDVDAGQLHKAGVRSSAKAGGCRVRGLPGGRLRAGGASR